MVPGAVKVIFLVCYIACLTRGQEENESPRQNQEEIRYRPGRRGPHRRTADNKLNTTLKNETANTTSHTRDLLVGRDDDEILQQAIALLQRLSDRLTALQALDEQQLRRLETLEYRLTKLEVQQQEKAESLRTELREVSRRVQQLDWQSGKIETTLESIKVDTGSLSQGQEHIRATLSQPDNRYSSLIESEMKNKLQVMLGAQLVLKGTAAAIHDDLNHIKANITKITNMTRNLLDLGGNVVTKQHLKTTIQDLKESSSWSIPVYHEPSSPEEDNLPWDCAKVQSEGNNQSGIYRIKPPRASKPFYVFCDMKTNGGGWTVIQNRFEGTIDFKQGWDDYKHGFGNLVGEFWLGLEKIHLLTNYKVNELYIQLEDFSFTKSFAYYSAFAIGNEKEGYPIHILGGYDGDAGDSLVYHAGMKFSTYDLDNDNWNGGNCAESHYGAWWYNGCDTSNLNGRYLGGEVGEDYEYQGMYWYDWHGPMYSLKESRIALRSSANDHTTGDDSGKKSGLQPSKNSTQRLTHRRHRNEGHKIQTEAE